MENKKMEIAKFYEQIFLDTKLKEKILKKVKKIEKEEDLRKLIQQEIMPLMKRFNANFSEEELLEYEEETLKKLSKEALGNVSGGVSIKSALLTGGLLSMALLGGTGLSASAMDDEPPALPEQKQIIQASSNEQQQNNSNNDKTDNDNSQNSESNADKEDVSRSGKPDEKASVTESNEGGGANAIDSETVVPETAPPRPSASEGVAPETNNDTEKEKLKKAFIKELLKHNVNLVSLYDKKTDGTFNDDAIAREINTVLGELKENNSVARVNWEQTNCDATTKCIKLATAFGEADVTFDEIRIFNLEKIRRAHARNLERHLAGRWEVFKGQRFAGILSGEHSLLDKNTNINGLVQKFTVKTPFGESDLWVYYINNGVLTENNRMIYNDNSKCFLPYDTIMDSFSKFSTDDQGKIRLAINDYLSKKVEDIDIERLNSGETPLAVFNDKVEICDIEDEDEHEQDEELKKKKKSAISDFAAILMFCENSHVRISTGGKWERGATNPEGKSLSANNPQGIDEFRKGYWLSIPTGTEKPGALQFSKAAVKTNKSLTEIQTEADREYKNSGATLIHPPKVASVDVYKKSESLNNLEISNSSDGDGQELEGTVHTVELKIQFGEKVYNILKTVKCVDGIKPENLITTKYKYLSPTVSKIDGKDIFT